MRRLFLLATVGAGLACAGPAKRPFTAADLGSAGPTLARPEPRPEPGPGRRPGASGGTAGPETALRVLPDGRLAPLDEGTTLAPALARFDGGLARARAAGDLALERQAWEEFLASVDEALGGAPPPRLDLLRAATAFDAGLAEVTDAGLAAALAAPVAARIARLDERLAAPPVRTAHARPVRRLGLPLEPLVVTSFFGPRSDPFDGRERWHLGVDLKAESGQAIFAAAAGTVVSAGWAGGHGRRVELAHADGVVTGYSHLSAILVEAGAAVEPGQPIGLAGSTGRSTGPHLHFELWRDGEPEDPLELFGDATVEILTAGP